MECTPRNSRSLILRCRPHRRCAGLPGTPEMPCNHSGGFGNPKIMGSTALETTVPRSRAASTRIPQLDALRGFFLVWMTLTHLPTRASAYSNQIIGYVSAAEGFILLAAVLNGRIQRHATQKYGPALARTKLWRRVLRIYSYHLVLLGVAFGLCGIAAVYLHAVPLQYLLDFYIAKPKTALAAAPLLLCNPPLLDILPIYIVFMLLTPAILWAAEKRGWLPVLSASACVWLLAQCNLRAWLYSLLAKAAFPIPLNEMGAFDWFGWQLLWVSGLALGNMKIPARWPNWVCVLCGAVAIMLFICRHSAFDALTGPALFDLLVDKWKLAILRLVDAAALGVLLLRFGSPLADSWFGRRLAVLGQASLEVFSAHVVLCLVFLGVGGGPDAHFTPWQDASILVITLLILSAVAARTAQRKRIAAANAGGNSGTSR